MNARCVENLFQKELIGIEGIVEPYMNQEHAVTKLDQLLCEKELA